MGTITTDQKLRLAQLIRAESQDNRLRMRSRERILYGTAKSDADALPLYHKGYQSGKEGSKKELYALEEPAPMQEEVFPSSFKFRLVLAVVLFAGFLILDAGGGSLFGITTTMIQEEVNKDFDTGITSVDFDFEGSFPYTLFQKGSP